MGGRALLFSVLLALPSALIVGVGGWLIAREVPRLVKYEPVRIGREYRERAEEMAQSKSSGAWKAIERRVGWRQVGKIEGRPWGYAVDRRRVTVWLATGQGRTCLVREDDALRPYPYALVFYGGGALTAAVLLGLSAFAILCLRRYMKERDDFLAATAHDLTTPLVGMRLLIGRNDAEAKRLNERMLLIVNNIKDFMRRGGVRRPPHPKPMDPVALTDEAYRLFAADYEDAESGAVAFEAARAGVPRVLADETMTLQILWNLFGNDLKYAAPHGKVAVRFAADGRFVRIAFVDEGQGMTARQMKRAFDRYYRAKTVLEAGKGGFGIGLCTARDFARAMGGDLTVAANVPKGCVFTLSLPAAL